jgi:hypothetical protein
MRPGARQAMAHQGHYAGALSRLLAYAADLGIISVVYAAAIAIIQFAINTATPWNVELKNGYVIVIIGQLAWSAVYFGSRTAQRSIRATRSSG